MKRSFSEFRTQRELGAKNLPKILKKCSDALNKLESQAVVSPSHDLSSMTPRVLLRVIDLAQGYYGCHTLAHCPLAV